MIVQRALKMPRLAPRSAKRRKATFAKMLYWGFRLVAALRIAYQLLFLCR